MGYLLKRKFFGAGPLRYFAAQDALIPCYDEFWVLFLSLSHSAFLCAGLSVLFGASPLPRGDGRYQRLDWHKFCRLDAVVVVHRVDTSGKHRCSIQMEAPPAHIGNVDGYRHQYSR